MCGVVGLVVSVLVCLTDQHRLSLNEGARQGMAKTARNVENRSPNRFDVVRSDARNFGAEETKLLITFLRFYDTPRCGFWYTCQNEQVLGRGSPSPPKFDCGNLAHFFKCMGKRRLRERVGERAEQAGKARRSCPAATVATDNLWGAPEPPATETCPRPRPPDGFMAHTFGFLLPGPGPGPGIRNKLNAN